MSLGLEHPSIQEWSRTCISQTCSVTQSMLPIFKILWSECARNHSAFSLSKPMKRVHQRSRLRTYVCHCQFPKGEIPAGPFFGHRTTRLCVCMLCGSRHSGLHVDLTYAIPLPIVKFSDGQYPSTTGEIIPRSFVPNRLSSVYNGDMWQVLGCSRSKTQVLPVLIVRNRLTSAYLCHVSSMYR